MTAWFKDAAAGVGLLAFIAGSFVLARDGAGGDRRDLICG